MLVLSDGEDTGSRLGGDDVLAKAQDDHVMVYTIGLRNRFFNGAQWVTKRRPTVPEEDAAQTGGGYFELTRATELNATFSKVADELHRQYLIAISPSTLDGKPHVLNVRVKTPGHDGARPPELHRGRRPSNRPCPPELASVAAAMSLLAGPAPGQGQQPPQVFRSGVSTVAIYASVTDRSGNPVQGLTRDRFRGVRRRPAPGAHRVQQRPPAHHRGAAGGHQRQHGADAGSRAATAAEQFVIRMMPGDRARVGNFSDRIDLGRTSPTTATSCCARSATTCTSAIRRSCGMRSA